MKTTNNNKTDKTINFLAMSTFVSLASIGFTGGAMLIIEMLKTGIKYF